MPTVFADLVPQVTDPGETISRSALAQRVVGHHEVNGGLAANGVATFTAKKALSMLQANGSVEQTAAKGYWRILERLEPTEAGPLEFGIGAEAVYVYYFPAYRDQALYLGRDEWPMKIGMTKGQVAFRIREQCSTAMPEEPVVGLIYRTDVAATGERLLHSMLDTRGRRLAGPGREWFSTSLTEVKNILDYATQRRTGH